jgi:hypothetical protein
VAKSILIIIRLSKYIQAWLFSVSLRVDITHIRLNISMVCYRERKGPLFKGKDISPRLYNIRRVLKKSRHIRHCV